MIFSFSGKVIHGKKLGRKIGFRTANIDLKGLILEEGTYKLNGYFGKKVYPGVGTYISKSNVFEAHFIGINKNLYGKTIDIFLLQKIRENKKFEGMNQIKAQIKKDIQFSIKNKIKVFTFGTFDIFHKGHSYYLKEAKKYGDVLYTIVARDINVKRLKGELPLVKEKQRVQILKEKKLSDRVLLGDIKDPLKWIKKYEPQIVCLGYDQVGFSKKLSEYIKIAGKNVEVIKLPPFKEKIYKSSLIKKKKLQKKIFN